MSMKHTPGPWEWIGHDLEQTGGDFKTVLELEVGCGGFCYGGSIEMTISEGDKCLIKSAPDMLTALETVLAGGHLNTGEQAIVANAIAKALGISIDEVLKYGV